MELRELFGGECDINNWDESKQRPKHFQKDYKVDFLLPSSFIIK